MPKKRQAIKKSLPWDEVEKAIRQEMNWLRDAIDVFHEKETGLGIAGVHYCRECLMRKIAIFIISGQVKARELSRTPPLKSFWITEKKNKLGLQHGQEWHRQTMAQVEDHFISQGYRVAREPSLHWGRADLGAYKKDEQDIMIEIGTTSFFKIWFNLAIMKNFTFLIVPNDDRLIEFIQTKKSAPHFDLKN